jgi:hypothetical protein
MQALQRCRRLRKPVDEEARALRVHPRNFGEQQVVKPQTTQKSEFHI